MADKEEKTEETKPEAAEAAVDEAKAEAKPKADAKPKAAAKPKAEPKAEAKAEAKPAPKKKAKSKKKAAVKADVNVPAVKAMSDKDAKLSPEVFAVEPKVGVLHEAARAELAARRRGTASTKKRGEVRGGGAKPWRQKGTGRARAGSSRMPHWTGGGIAFGPTPRDYSFKVNRKVRLKALKMALSARASEGNLKIVDALPFEEPKTAAAAAVLDGLGVSYPLLVLVGDEETNAAMSFRNLPRVAVCNASELGVADVLAARTVLLSKPVLDQLNGMGDRK
jgi:large subunit ribosomal protein L4